MRLSGNGSESGSYRNEAEQIPSDHPIFELWDRLTEFYGRSFVSQYGAAPSITWYASLDDLSPADYGVGINALRDRTNSFPPNPAEFRELAKGHQGGVQDWQRQAHKPFDPPKSLPDKTAQEEQQRLAMREIKKLRAMLGGSHG